MNKPDQRLFEADLLSAAFRNGESKGLWGLAGADVVPADLVWPRRILWMASAPRTNAPDRFYVQLDLTGYRFVPPTGTFWEPATATVMDLLKRQKGKPGSRFAMVFRTNWQNGMAFYHPYDRVAAQSHSQGPQGWSITQPHLVWTSEHTIVDWLEEFHSLLNCEDYLGI